MGFGLNLMAGGICGFRNLCCFEDFGWLLRFGVFVDACVLGSSGSMIWFVDFVEF